MLSALLLATLVQTAHATPPSERAAQMQPQLTVVSRRPLYSADAAAILWLERNDGALSLAGVDPWWSGILTERFEQPVGNGVWIQLLDRRLQVLGSFRGAVPPPGETCGQEIPVVRGTWWALFIERRDGRNTFLAQLEVGPELMEVVERNRLPIE